MKSTMRLLIILLLAMGLSACASMRQHSSGWLKKSDNAYLKQRSIPKLRIPSGLSASKVGNDYPIPPATGVGAVPASTVPPGGIHAHNTVKKHPNSNHGYFLKPLF